MKQGLSVVLVLAIVLCMLTGCSKYPASYNATLFVHSNTSKSATMSFGSFDGHISFKLKNKEASNQLVYSAKLETGSATVYIDTDGTKKELFTINAGDEVDSAIGELEVGEIYIIVETTEKCKEGKMEFKIR